VVGVIRVPERPSAVTDCARPGAVVDLAVEHALCRPRGGWVHRSRRPAAVRNARAIAEAVMPATRRIQSEPALLDASGHVLTAGRRRP